MKAADVAIRNALARSIFDVVTDKRAFLLRGHTVEVTRTTLLTVMLTIHPEQEPESEGRCFVLRMSELMP